MRRKSERESENGDYKQMDCGKLLDIYPCRKDIPSVNSETKH